MVGYKLPQPEASGCRGTNQTKQVGRLVGSSGFLSEMQANFSAPPFSIPCTSRVCSGTDFFLPSLHHEPLLRTGHLLAVLPPSCHSHPQPIQPAPPASCCHGDLLTLRMQPIPPHTYSLPTPGFLSPKDLVQPSCKLKSGSGPKRRKEGTDGGKKMACGLMSLAKIQQSNEESLQDQTWITHSI